MYLSKVAAAVSRCLSAVAMARRYTDQVDVEGEFTKGVLTMVAKHSKPEMASRLAHGPGQVGFRDHSQCQNCSRNTRWMCVAVLHHIGEWGPSVFGMSMMGCFSTLSAGGQMGTLIC